LELILIEEHELSKALAQLTGIKEEEPTIKVKSFNECFSGFFD